MLNVNVNKSGKEWKFKLHAPTELWVAVIHMTPICPGTVSHNKFHHIIS